MNWIAMRRGYRPPVAARAFAYMGLAGYETIVSGTKDYQSVAPNFAGLTIPKVETGQTYHWPTAVNAAYFVTMKRFFPHVTDAYKAKMEQLGNGLFQEFQSQTDATTFERSKKFGESMGNAVFDFSKTDINGHEAYLNPHPADYVPPTARQMATDQA